MIQQRAIPASFQEWHLYGNVECRLVALYLLWNADKEGKVNASLASLSYACDLSVKQVRTALDRMVAAADITCDGARKGQVISVMQLGAYGEWGAKGVPVKPRAPRTQKGPDPDVQFVIDHLKEKVGPVLNGSQQKNRQFAHLLIQKLKKEYPDNKPRVMVERLVQLGLGDDFYAKHMASAEFLYRKAGTLIQLGKERKGATVPSEHNPRG